MNILVLEHELKHTIAPASRMLQLYSELQKKNEKVILIGTSPSDSSKKLGYKNIIQYDKKFSGYLFKIYLRISIFFKIFKLFS